MSVAAETANSYVSLRTCERQLVVATNDAKSRAETSRLPELTEDSFPGVLANVIVLTSPRLAYEDWRSTGGAG